MKKLMFGLVAVLATVAAQAAYVDWQYQGTNAKNDTSWGDSTTTAANGYTAYLLTAAAWDSIKATAADASDIAGKATDSSTLIYEKTKKSVAYYTTHADGSTLPGERQATVANKNDNYYIILANDDGFAIVANNVAITGYDDASTGGGQTPGLAKTGMDNATAITAAMTAYPGAGSTPDIPEPTSALLLLMGGAMLALRRKQK